MATLEQRLSSVIQAIGADIKALKTAKGDLSSLSTTQKSNLVGALNEIFTLASSKATQSDITTAIDSLKTEIMGGGVPEALNTLKEIATYIESDETLGVSLSTAVTKRVRFDDVQTLTTPEKLQACTNIGIGNPDTDLVAVFNAALV